jgi:hypothetical protein
MPSFEEMFIATKGEPITYRGRTLVMSDAFSMNAMTKLCLTFETCNGGWKQGVALKSDGDFAFNGVTYSGKTGLVFWHDTSPDSVDFDVVPTVSTVRVYNVWDVGDGVVHARHNGAAMIVEELPTGRRYRCNDGEADEDFDDVIFRIERVA